MTTPPKPPPPPKSFLPQKPQDLFHCAQAMTLCYKQFSYCCPPLVLEWDPSTSSFLTHSKTDMNRYTKWFISVLITATGILSQLQYLANFSLTVQCIFAPVFMSIGCLVLGSAGVSCVFVHEIVLGFSRMKALILNDCRFETTRGSVRGQWGWIDLFLQLNVRNLCWMSILTPIIVVWEGFDPFRSIFEYFGVASLISVPLRCILMLICFTEGCRIYALTIILIFLWEEIKSRYFKSLRLLGHSETHTRRFFTRYTNVQLASQTMDGALSELTRVLLVCFFVIIVICYAGTLRYGSIVPLHLLWWLPLCGTMDVAVIFIIFPYVTASHEVTKNMISARKRGISVISSGKWNLHTVKWALKKLRSMKPISVKCGKFVLERTAKARFYNAIVQRTVDGVLL